MDQDDITRIEQVQAGGVLCLACDSYCFSTADSWVFVNAHRERMKRFGWKFFAHDCGGEASPDGWALMQLTPEEMELDRQTAAEFAARHAELDRRMRRIVIASTLMMLAVIVLYLWRW